jgi:hypothetical protein
VYQFESGQSSGAMRASNPRYEEDGACTYSHRNKRGNHEFYYAAIFVLGCHAFRSFHD